jgi:hypothetical protein
LAQVLYQAFGLLTKSGDKLRLNFLLATGNWQLATDVKQNYRQPDSGPTG